MKANELNDVKVLALKRWNLPQTKSVLYEHEEKYYGEYISFQGHHFFDIISVEPGTIPVAYSEISRLRANQQADQDKDVHIVQSMTIIGKDKGFWTENADRLYVTFIQLSNTIERNVDKLEEAVGDVIRRCSKGKRTQWALYYALDFCDMVLFTKGINLNAYHNVLWHLALVRGGILDGVRDTFTMCGFHRDYLSKAFCAIDNKKPFIWNEQMALSVNLSIQSMSTWTLLTTELKSAAINYQVRRTSGRYDLNIYTRTISGTKVLKLLRAIDKLCEGTKDTVFGGYEVQFLAPAWRTKKCMPKNAVQDRSFENEANELMDKLCQEYCILHKASSDYVDETCRSFKALLKNGFSEEFVLSVFISFAAFLRISLLFENEGARSYVTQKLEVMNRKYFTELNTLALCTMHNERQFIQAPSFNASYFDIPPKMLAFYSAAVFNIVQTLWDGNEPVYRFVIAPDYKNDIYVSSLLVDEKIQIEERLAVIRLSELFFYDPVNAIALLCHEISHYVSDRKRKVRADGILYMVSLSVLCRTPLFEMVDSPDTVINGISILDLLSRTMADVLLEVFELDMTDENDQLNYHLINVKEFLSDNNYGLDLFNQQIFCEIVVSQWKDKLCQAYESGKLNIQELSIAVKSIEETLSTKYISQMLSDILSEETEASSSQLFSIIARNIILQIRRLIKQPQSNIKHKKLCEDIIAAYSEAYADLKMAQVMGSSFSIELYENLLNNICDTKEVLCNLRHDAVCQIVSQGESIDEWSMNSVSKIDKFIYRVAVNNIQRYLEQCYQPKVRASLIEKAGLIFQGSDAGEQLQLVYDAINCYRDEIREYCRNALNHNVGYDISPQ